jgi:hypothetical protein
MRTLLTSLIVLALMTGAGCRRPPAPTTEVVAISSATLPTDPLDASWAAVPEHVAQLIPQDLVEPRLMKISTETVRVRARASNGEIALRLEWADPTVSDLPGAGQFPDGCAVQFPQKAAASLPDPQMGQPGHGVDLTFWRADWQASVNGRGDSIQDLYPNAAIDHYPFEAPSLERGSAAQQTMSRLYAPADGAGNRRGGHRASPVEDLVAEGPGTLSPATATRSRGTGVRTANGWVVLITRPFPDGLSPDARAHIAFAVWEGGAQETGARKMRSGWVPVSLRAEP